MGNDPSKRTSGPGDDEDDPDGPVRIGSAASRKRQAQLQAQKAQAAAGTHALTPAELEGATLGGHTPYHAPLTAVSPPPGGASGAGADAAGPRASFDVDRHTDALYASLDDAASASVPGTPAAPHDGPISIGGGSSAGGAGGAGKKRTEGEIVQVSRAADDGAGLLHPELEALLNMAQFYPQDPGLSSRPGAIPSNALNITPVLLRPRAVMDVYVALAQRWSGVGGAALRAQVLVGKEMDKLESSVQAALPALIERQAQIRALNQELQRLPELHAHLQQQKQAVAQCVASMQELNNLLPAHARLEDLDDLLEWQEAKTDEEDEEGEGTGQIPNDANGAEAQPIAASAAVPGR